MKKEISTKILCNDNDVKQAIIYIINHVKKSWKLFLIPSVVIVGILIYGIKNGFESYLYFILLLCIALDIIFYIIFYKMPISSYINFYRKRQEATYIFSELGVQLADKSEKSYDWDLFINAYETPTAFILSDVKMNYYIFPRRCFENISDIEILINLLSKKVANFRKI
ncbi:YcxB family protein [Ruminiclostridium herbifermentans]|uniref:YcxB family protein n=1 Tax=Ruminiclostridium herbifermentans TaxID=2488810 RepID=A0A4U7JK97_9FIRM|nr:YcxB family protein [Ruminiclostridium herbifermentans]QNU65306.1 YcxB family protein [Ruminiclostridium herbifermentans]